MAHFFPHYLLESHSVEMTKNALTIFLKKFRQINLADSLDSHDLNYEWFFTKWKSSESKILTFLHCVSSPFII